MILFSAERLAFYHGFFPAWTLKIPLIFLNNLKNIIYLNLQTCHSRKYCKDMYEGRRKKSVMCVCVCVCTYAWKCSKYGEGSSGKWKAHNSEWKLQSSAFKWECFTFDQQCASPSHRPSNINTRKLCVLVAQSCPTLCNPMPSNINTKELEQKNLIRISILKF